MTAPASLTAPLTKKARILRFVAAAKAERTSFEPDWQECADFVTPRRYRRTTTDRNKGGRATSKIIDSTATFALRTLASGMMSGLSSPARPWFRLMTKEPQLYERGPVKTWLAEATRIMLTVIGRSNAYTKFEALYKDLGAFGISALSLVEDEDDVIHCDHFAVGSYWLATNHKGQVRGFVREFSMTVEQVVTQFIRRPDGTFDWGKASRTVRSAWAAGEYLQPVTVTHVVAENGRFDARRLESKYKRFYACYLEAAAEEDTFLAEEGFDEFPVFGPRWEAIGGDTYACEWPCSVALGDIKQLQAGEKQLAKAIAKMVDPPLKASFAMRRERIALNPGEISYDDSPDERGLRPIHEVRPEVFKLEDLQDRKRALIQQAFFADLFLMLANSQQRSNVTAREIEERHEEKLLALGPVLERLNTEFFDPFINRVFNICLRRGLFPPPPPELEGQELPVEYISIMAQAQKMVALASVDHLLSRAERIALLKPNDPSALDKLDTDQLLDEIGDMTGVPPRVIVSDEQVAAQRAERAAAQQQQMMTEQAAQQATAARDLAAADTSGKNALTDLLAMTAGPAAGVAPGGPGDGGMMP